MKFGDHCLVLIRNLTSVISGLKMDFSQLKSWAYMMMSCFTFFFCLYLTSLVHFSHSLAFSWSFPIVLTLLGFDLISSHSHHPALVPVLCLFFWSFCLPPCLHCSDVLNLLRGLLKLSWWTTHRMKAQLHKRTTSKAKYVLFNSWKYVSTVKQIYFSRSVIDPKEQKTVAL